MREISEKFVKKCKDDKMKVIFRGIFISLALLAGSGLRGWCATLEFIDSLRTELRLRNMPERVLFLPLALADQRADDGREGIWSLTVLDAIRGEALCRKAATESDKGTGDVAEELMTNDREVVRTEQGRGVASNLIGRSSCDLDSTDVRFDDYLSTVIALDRLQELFNEYGDWRGWRSCRSRRRLGRPGWTRCGRGRRRTPTGLPTLSVGATRWEESRQDTGSRSLT